MATVNQGRFLLTITSFEMFTDAICITAEASVALLLTLPYS